jgi:hypothetical protein
MCDRNAMGAAVTRGGNWTQRTCFGDCPIPTFLAAPHFPRTEANRIAPFTEFHDRASRAPAGSHRSRCSRYVGLETRPPQS